MDNIEKFVIYIRTKQIYNQRLKADKSDGYVYINESVKNKYQVADDHLKKLCTQGILEYSEKGFRVTTIGPIDLTILPKKKSVLTPITEAMKNYLQDVSLPEEAPSTLHFDIFLHYKKSRPDLFFSVDGFSGRVHTPVVNFHRTHRPNILLKGEKTESLDVQTMQPLILGKILFKALGPNQYSDWIHSGEDIYVRLQNGMQLNTRDEAKKRFFEIIFGYPNKKLSDAFGGSNWINWINDFKTNPIKDNPHSQSKPHSNLAWLLQKTEVMIMTEVWKKLLTWNIPFLSVHDEIIIRQSDLEQSERIFDSVLKEHFTYYRLNRKSYQPAAIPDIASEVTEPCKIETPDHKIGPQSAIENHNNHTESTNDGMEQKATEPEFRLPDRLSTTIKTELTELFNVVFTDNNNYSESDMIQAIVQSISIDQAEATLYFNYMKELDVISEAAPGRYYKHDGIPF
jgi:hypothetical protein